MQFGHDPILTMTRVVFVVFFFFCLLALVPGGSAQSLAGRNVVSVQYDPPRQPLDPRDLANMQLMKTGEPLNLNQVGSHH